MQGLPSTESDSPSQVVRYAKCGDILVVDDHPPNLVAIRAALGDFEGDIVEARSGTEALGVLLLREVALILLDVKMPSMDGFETARMIRSRKRSRYTPIIFITAHDRDDDDVLEAYKLGAVDFLSKPILTDVLRAKVAVFVELQRRTAEVALQAELLREHERREHERVLEAERRRWEAEALRRQMDDLAKADKRKDEFLAVLGHELRNPLAPIVAGVEILRQRLTQSEGADPVVVRTCRTMQRQTEHITRLVDDLLDVARITSNKIELRPENVVLRDIVEQAIATSRPFIDERKHELRVEMPDEPVVLRGDAVRLVQSIANLLNNAARYTDPGGKIEIRCVLEGDSVQIHVHDNGRGISPDFLPKIFEMFIQEQGSARGGLGLGLTLASHLVALHGGTIRARSEGPGKGSEFVVTLPVDPSLSAPASKTVHPPQQGKFDIVLVDDNPDVRETMRELLVAWGHRVEMAQDGASAIDLILRVKPDFAFVDIGLPDMDGYGVAERVRDELGAAETRLIAMTGFGRDADRRQARAAGFDAHLAKPASIDSIKKVLSTEKTTWQQ
jgi:signal transduction histidine kinase